MADDVFFFNPCSTTKMIGHSILLLHKRNT